MFHKTQHFTISFKSISITIKISHYTFNSIYSFISLINLQNLEQQMLTKYLSPFYLIYDLSQLPFSSIIISTLTKHTSPISQFIHNLIIFSSYLCSTLGKQIFHILFFYLFHLFYLINFHTPPNHNIYLISYTFICKILFLYNSIIYHVIHIQNIHYFYLA